MYLMPHGTPAAGLQSGIKMFGTDYIADGTNYNDFGLWAGSDYNYINSKKSGTGVAKDFVFAYNDTNYLMTIQTGGNVGIGTTTTTQKLTVVGGSITTDNQLISTVATGTSPLTVNSTTTVSNLSADLLDGHDTSYFQTALTNPVTGTGTTNYLAKWGASSLGSSVIYDDGTNVGIGTTSPTSKLYVYDTNRFRRDRYKVDHLLF